MSSEMVCYYVAFVAFLVKESYISIKRLMTHRASLESSKRAKIPLLTLVSWVLNSHGPQGVFIIGRLKYLKLYI